MKKLKYLNNIKLFLGGNLFDNKNAKIIIFNLNNSN